MTMRGVNQPVGGHGAGPFYRWRVRHGMGRKKMGDLLDRWDGQIQEWDWNGIPEKHLRFVSEKCGFDFQPRQDKWKYGEVGPTDFDERILWLARHGHKPSLWAIARLCRGIVPNFAAELQKQRGIKRRRAARINDELREAREAYLTLKTYLRTNRRKHEANHAVVEGA